MITFETLTATKINTVAIWKEIEAIENAIIHAIEDLGIESISGKYKFSDDINNIKRSYDERKKRELLPSLIEMKHLAYGMSSKLAQQKRGLETLKTSEGRQNYVSIKYTLKQWVENMDSYLRSAMSYTDSKKLEFFTDKTVEFVVNSPTVQNTINH